jgi:hypothetical protein
MLQPTMARLVADDVGASLDLLTLRTSVQSRAALQLEVWCYGTSCRCCSATDCAALARRAGPCAPVAPWLSKNMLKLGGIAGRAAQRRGEDDPLSMWSMIVIEKGGR